MSFDHIPLTEKTDTDYGKWLHDIMSDCTLCPRKCHVNRLVGEIGYCGQTARLTAARAALHFWEEPCISGNCGSGTVFFSGCNLRCVFCQNHNIALGKTGRDISPERLSDIFLELQEKGAHNINLVTPTHFTPQIVLALEHAKAHGLSIPIVYNTSSYEEVSSLRCLDGLIDIYLPDLKYFSWELGRAYSHAPDYFEKATAAIAEMYRQVGGPVFVASGSAAASTDSTSSHTLLSETNAGSNHTAPDCTVELLQRGMIVRHLILPGQTRDSKKILRYLHETYGDDIYISIMNQYTPLPQVAGFPELNRKVTDEEYQRVLTFAERIGIEYGFWQEVGAASESFIPEFDGEGV